MPANGTGQSAAAFSELLALLDEARQRFAGDEWGLVAPDDIAGAVRNLAHILETGLVLHFEDDPAHPVFRPIVTSTRKAMGDNADAMYYDAPVSPDHVYRITGKIARAVYTSFTLEGGAVEGAMGNRTAGVLNDSDIDIDRDGGYEIRIGGPPAERNWLELAPDAHRVTTRHYWEEERSPQVPPRPDVALTIAVIGDVPPPPPPDDASVAAALRRVANHVRTRTIGMPPPGEREQPAFVSTTPNEFPPPVKPGDHALAAADAAYSMAPFLLGPDEALVIRGAWPQCRCANVNLWNRHMQTFDYVNRSTALNRAQTVLEDDGSWRMVIAHADPGVPNWLDTEGRPFGMVFFRYFLPEGEIVTPQAEVVGFDALDALAGSKKG